MRLLGRGGRGAGRVSPAALRRERAGGMRPQPGSPVPTGLCCSGSNQLFGAIGNPSTCFWSRGERPAGSQGHPPPNYVPSPLGISALVCCFCLDFCFLFFFFLWIFSPSVCFTICGRTVRHAGPMGPRVVQEWGWPGQRGWEAAAPSSCQTPELRELIPGREFFIFIQKQPKNTSTKQKAEGERARVLVLPEFHCGFRGRAV